MSDPLPLPLRSLPLPLPLPLRSLPLPLPLPFWVLLLPPLPPLLGAVMAASCEGERCGRARRVRQRPHSSAELGVLLIDMA